MLQRFHEFLENRRNGKETGAAFIFAVLLMMVVTMTVVLITATVITGSKTASTLNQRETLKQAAEAGLNNALLQANQGVNTILETRRGVANAQIGTMTSATSITRNQDYALKWKWYTQQVVFPGQRTGYYVYSVGYSSNPAIKDTVTLRSQFLYYTVASAHTNVSSSDLTYEFANPWETGLGGLTSIVVQNGAKVYIGDSNYGPTPAGTDSTGATVVTNNAVTLNGTATGIANISYGRNNASSTCTGTGCAGTAKTYRGVDVSTKQLDKLFQAGGVCAPGGTYPIWRASENGGVLSLPSGTCVGGLIFDRDTTIPASYSKTNPLILYNAGQTTVYKGARVNTSNIPLAFQVYSTNNFTLGDTSVTVSTTNRTYAGFEFATSNGSCNILAGSTYFGTFSCANSNISADTITYIDMGVKDATNAMIPTARKAWYMTYTEEL